MRNGRGKKKMMRKATNQRPENRLPKIRKFERKKENRTKRCQYKETKMKKNNQIHDDYGEFKTYVYDATTGACK